MFFRFQTIEFPSAKDVLSGEGARVRGGRWNQPGLAAIYARLIRVLDLSLASIRRTLGVTLKELATEDWRKLMLVGLESSSQALGRAAAAVGASGLLVRSAAIAQGINLVAFPHAHPCVEAT